MSILPEYKKMDVREGNAESWGKGIGYNQAVDECQSALDAAVGEAACVDKIKQTLLRIATKTYDEKRRTILVQFDSKQLMEASEAISTRIKQVFSNDSK